MPATSHWWLSAAAITLLLLIVGICRWRSLGPYPPGVDEGAWLGYGRTWFGDGQKGHIAGYAPLIPTMLYGLAQFMGPFAASRVVALLSFLLLAFVFFTVLRRLGVVLLIAIGGSLLLSLNGLFAEGITHGGYGQAIAIAFMLVALLAVLQYMGTESMVVLIIASCALAVVALSHHVYFIIAAGTWVMGWLAWLSTKPGRKTATRVTLALAGAGGTGAACWIAIWLHLERLHYAAPLGTSGQNWEWALAYAVRDSRHIWLGVLGIGIAYLVLRIGERRRPWWQMSFALLGVGIPLFVVTGEIRVAPVILLGSLISTCMALNELARNPRPVVAAAALSSLFWVSLIHLDNAVTWQDRYNAFYHAADPDLEDAANYLEPRYNDGYFVVMEGPNAAPIGWWFEGLTDAAVMVGSEQKWLGFPKERENARIADLFFERPLTGLEAMDEARHYRVAYLVFLKSGFDGWEEWTADPGGPIVAHQNRTWMILDVRPRP